MSDEERVTWKKSKFQIGRAFNKELAEEIIRRMTACEDLREICREPHMPKIRAIASWRKQNPEFNKAFLQAFHSGRGVLSPSTNEHLQGRPTIRTKAIEEEIIARLQNGELLAQICRLDHMPRAPTIYNWISIDPNFCNDFSRARILGAQAIVAECIEIADDGKNDYYEKTSKSGEVFVALDSENIQRSRLRIDTRKWIVGSIDPTMREHPQVKLNINTPEVGSISIGTDQQTPASPQEALTEYQKMIKGE